MTVVERIGLSLAPPAPGKPYDLHLDASGNLALVRDAEAVAQHARQRLMTFEGEWFLDTTAGVPWLADLFGKAFDTALAEAVVKAELLDTDGVVEIASFSVRFGAVARNLIISDINVVTDYDEAVSI